MNPKGVGRHWIFDLTRFWLFLRAVRVRLLWKLREWRKGLNQGKVVAPVLGLPPLGSSASSKRALVVYSTEAYHDASFREHPPHQLYILSQRIVETLRQQGYTVDLFDLQDPHIFAPQEYALIFSHSFSLSAAEVPCYSSAFRVYFATGLLPDSQNKRVFDREKLFRSRRHSQRAIELRTDDSPIPFPENAHAILWLENRFEPNDWAKIAKGQLLSSRNVTLPEVPRKTSIAKESTKRSRRVLFAASSGQLLKGLDLVLEAASLLPDCEFTICSSFLKERNFCKEYWRELFLQTNVLPLGWLPPYSEVFQEVVANHDFYVLPSCSESCSGTVIHLSASGLIPIVTKSTGIDVSEFGFWIEDISPQGVADAIDRALAITDADLTARQEKARAYIRHNFSTEAFDENIRQVVRVSEEQRIGENREDAAILGKA